MNMRNIYIKWKPKLNIIYENNIIDKPVKIIQKKFQNKKIQHKKIQNKKLEINDLAVECFEF